MGRSSIASSEPGPTQGSGGAALLPPAYAGVALHRAASASAAAATEFAAFITCAPWEMPTRLLLSGNGLYDLLTFDIVLRYVGVSQTSRWLGPK